MTTIQTLFDAAASGDLDQVRRLVALGMDPLEQESRALGEAACEGHVDVVAYLRDRSDETENDYYPLRMAADAGWLNCVKVLAEKAPTDALDRALSMAGNSGKTLTADYLLSLTVSDGAKYQLLLDAVQSSDDALIDLALKHSDPRQDESEVLCKAIANGDEVTVEKLWSLCDHQAQHSRPLLEAALASMETLVHQLLPGADLKALGQRLKDNQHWVGMDALAPYVDEPIVRIWMEKLTADEQIQVPILNSRMRAYELGQVDNRPLERHGPPRRTRLRVRA